MSFVNLEYGPVISLSALKAPVDAIVDIPGSKSITNRALLLAGLASGQSVLRKPLYSDDTVHMINALVALGAQISETENRDLIVEGTAGQLQTPKEPLFIGNSGTSVRFLTAACVHSPANSSVILDGIARMRQRPIQDLIDALAPIGGHVESIDKTGCPPVRVNGGGLRGGETIVNGAISSQYLSALMMSVPLAHANTKISIQGELVSKPYVTMTMGVMHEFGADVTQQSDQAIVVPSHQIYYGADYLIEPDASNASYFLAAAAVTGGKVTIKHLGDSSIQGDVNFAKVLEQTGCRAIYAPDSINLIGTDKIKPVDVDLTLMPDMAQTLAVVALFANGTSRITGIHTLKVKETDRIEAITTELRKLGAIVESGADYWIITPPNKIKSGVAIDTYDDHRMAMSFAVAGLRIDGLTIHDPGCVSKTFPDFWQRWRNAFYGSA